MPLAGGMALMAKARFGVTAGREDNHRFTVRVEARAPDGEHCSSGNSVVVLQAADARAFRHGQVPRPPR